MRDTQRLDTGGNDDPTRRRFLRDAGQTAAAMTAIGTGGVLLDTARAAARTTSLDRLARDAVIFGAPVVLQSRYLALSLKAGVRLNRFSVNLTLSTPATKAAGPNDDTLYGLTWLDLTTEPQVISVPATRGRYFSIQLIDMWSNAFAYIGTRATGDGAGSFAITPPGWSGRLPAGVRRIAAPTKRLLALVRTFVKDPADLAAAQRIQTSYTIASLSRHPHDRVRPHVEGSAAALDVFTPLDLGGAGPGIFREINELIAEYPPRGVDARHARALRPVGVDVARYRPPSRSLAPVLRRAVKPAIGEVLAAARRHLTEVNGWTVNLHVPNVSHDPLRRAALTIEGPGTHVAREALYFGATELRGEALTGAHRYTLTFARGEQPPVGAFWSLILYDATTFLLVANPIHRYEIASHTDGLVHDSGGALAIAIAHDRPADPAVNWLPAPTGAFRLVLRTYLPRPAILQRRWSPPPLIRS